MDLDTFEVAIVFFVTTNPTNKAARDGHHLSASNPFQAKWFACVDGAHLLVPAKRNNLMRKSSCFLATE